SDLRIAVGAHTPDACKKLGNLLIARTFAQKSAEVVPLDSEEAGEQFALRRKPRPRAIAAEWLADRRDDPDLAGPIQVTPTPRDFAAVIGACWFDRQFGIDPLRDFPRGDHVVQPPPV